MAFRLGPILAGASAGAKSLEASRDKEAAKQMLLEDRLAQKEMRELQKRTLEQALNKVAPQPEWETKETETGDYVQIDPRTGQTRAVTMQGKPVRAPKKEKPETAPSYSFQQDKDGNIVGINPRNPTQVVRTGVSAPEKPQPGAAEMQTKQKAAASTLALLNEIAADVEANGTDIDPRSSRRAGLASKYAQFQLKLKDAARLGALSQSDLDIMLNTLNDPTSTVARGKALGSEKIHRANVLAGIAAVRSTLERDSGAGSGGKKVSAADAAKAAADPAFAAWLKSQGYEVP